MPRKKATIEARLKAARDGGERLKEAGKPYRFKKGVSGNPGGRKAGSKNKMKEVPSIEQAMKLMMMEDGSIAPSTYLMMLLQRNVAQNTSAGDKMALDCIREINKYTEASKDAKEANKNNVEDLTNREIEERLFKIVND